MDLSAVAGSPAFIALQTLAAQSAAPGTAATADTASPSAAPDAASTTVGSGASLYALGQGLSQALSASDAASSAGQSVLGLLQQMGAAAVQASQAGLSSADRAALDQGFQAAAAAIGPTLKSAAVGGVNLVDGSQTGALKVALGDGAQASLPPQDLTLQGANLNLTGASLTTPESAANANASVAAAAQAASSVVATLRSQASGLAAHSGFLQALGQASAMPSSDDGGDGARLMALQIGQQLSTQGGAIANAAPSQLLALFQG